jgi:hypothetical protein
VDETADGRTLSISQLRLLALTICRHIVQLFHQGRPAQTTSQIADALSFSPALVDKLADLLVQGEVLTRTVNAANGDHALQPARDIGSLTVQTVIAAMEDVGDNGRSRRHRSESESLSTTLAALRTELERSPSNRLLMDL